MEKALPQRQCQEEEGGRPREEGGKALNDKLGEKSQTSGKINKKKQNLSGREGDAACDWVRQPGTC